MIFSSKKSVGPSKTSSPVLRSRDNASGGGRENPLARRFHPDDEPDTIDLEDPGRFHSESDEADPPTTRFLGEADDPSHEDAHQAPGGNPVITQDADSGKFYIQPGEEVLLGDGPVLSPTELRSGDIIRIGSAEFKFL